VNLWVVGQLKDDDWDFQGVFSSEEKALAACKGPEYFVGPCTLDQEAPEETVDWPNGYLPRFNQ
jgi:hypothetical protein